LFFSITGCATGGPPPLTPIDRRNTITAEEIENARSPSIFAWDLISTLRPHFLRSQSAVGLTERNPVFAAIYVDEVYRGELDILKSLSVDGIKSIQFIPPYDTTARFGQTLQGGAIVIRTH
jgi:hypothetical protein